MNHGHAMNGWTKAGMAVLLLVLLPLTNGCTFGGKRTLAGASVLSYVPYRAATKPIKPTPYQAEPHFFGYHSTCWRSWPEYWMGCPTFPAAEETRSDLLAPAAESIPAATPEPIPAPQ